MSVFITLRDKLDEEKVLEILELRKTLSVPNIAKRFGINEVTVRKVIKGQTWMKRSKAIRDKQIELQNYLDAEIAKKDPNRQVDKNNLKQPYRVHMPMGNHPTACGVHNYLATFQVTEDPKELTCANCMKRLRLKGHQPWRY